MKKLFESIKEADAKTCEELDIETWAEYKERMRDRGKSAGAKVCRIAEFLLNASIMAVVFIGVPLALITLVVCIVKLIWNA